MNGRGCPDITNDMPDTDGTGIKPDTEVSAEHALKTAHLAALQEILKEHPDRKEMMEPLIEKLNAN